MDFTVTQAQLDKMFPLHLILDEDFNIKSYSNKIHQFTGPITGHAFIDVFLIKESSQSSRVVDLSAKLIGQFFYLQLISHPEIVLFGKLEYISSENHVIFYGDLENKNIGIDSNSTVVYKNEVRDPGQLTKDRLIVDEKWYRDLYLHNPALIYTHSIDGQLLSYNPAVQNILGYSENDLIGLNITELLPADDRKYFKSEYLDKVVSESGGKGIFRILPKSGNDVLYMYYQNYKVEELNSRSYIIGFSQNITDRIKIERELRFSKRASENLVKQKELFLANMSHEIRTPINGILGLNNLLLKTRLDEQQEHYVRLSSESISSLLILVNDILDIEKIGFGKIGFESHPFNISHKVARTVQLFQNKAKESGLEIFLNDSLTNDLTVIGDQYRFSQILSNLLSNAIKFTKFGSIIVTVTLVHELDDQVEIAFSIKDTGIGLSEKNIEEIFKPFVQASVSTARNYGGTGLGLSICKKLIEMQGGHIKVYSKLGSGSEFVFTLSYKKNSESAIIENKSTVIDYSKLRGKKVLVGEDLELNQFLIKTLLESWGCEIDIVDNGIKIIEQLKANKYDVILMDIQMPEMDGLTATKQIRGMKDSVKASIPIVAFTAGAMKGDIQKYKSVKMNDFILKPYSEKYLFDKMISVLNLKEPVFNENDFDEKQSSVTLANEQLYDLSPIIELSKHDDEVFNKVLNILISMLSTETNNIKFIAKKKDWKAIAEIVHKIKTSLIHINAHSLTKIIKRLEHYENYTDERLTLFTNELCDSLDDVLVFLKIDLVSFMNKNQ